MCTGELEFDSIFHQEPSGERDELSDVPFFFLSYLFWTAFIIFIPILLINMLVCCRTTTYLDIPLYTWVGLDKIDELSILLVCLRLVWLLVTFSQFMMKQK